MSNFMNKSLRTLSRAFLLMGMFMFLFSVLGTAQSMRKMRGKKVKGIPGWKSISKKYIKKGYLRHIGNGVGTKESTAKKKATLNALTAISRELQVRVKNAASLFEKEEEVEGVFGSESDLDDLTVVASKNTLSGLKEIGYELYAKKDKGQRTKYIYNAYVLLSISKKELVDNIVKTLSEKAKKKKDFDKAKFQKVFEKEMEEFSTDEGI